ncbi:hypothetical protein [Streptomyces sp. VRA16 Mangrove soil]|uniref:hypothetical protein n=1 Tax=Streptomyces sp. VRA16 Mangrove soil TaxID=2817434 RepID=UPI001A9D087E|nr:hypothetical protein [Streptomyces sp. VRA16 Mangrove soil]MBO1337409.1 hypothetical protein [Streptomyces sp. VRA16 Mangrove soil]
MANQAWREGDLRLVDRFAELQEEIVTLKKERAALVAYVFRLHAGRISPPDGLGRRVVCVDTAAGELNWSLDAEEAALMIDSGDAERGSGRRDASVDTLLRLSFLHLHRRPNRPYRRRSPSE